MSREKKEHCLIDGGTGYKGETGTTPRSLEVILTFHHLLLFFKHLVHVV